MPPHPPSQCLRQQYLYLNFTCAQSSRSLPQPVKDVPGHLQQCPLTTDQRRFPEIPWKFRDKRQTAQGKEHSYTALYSQCLAHSRCSGIFVDCLVGILRIKHGLKIVLADWWLPWLNQGGLPARARILWFAVMSARCLRPCCSLIFGVVPRQRCSLLSTSMLSISLGGIFTDLFPMFSTILSCSAGQGWASQAVKVDPHSPTLPQNYGFTKTPNTFLPGSFVSFFFIQFLMKPNPYCKSIFYTIQTQLCQKYLVFLVRSLQSLVPVDRISGNPSLHWNQQWRNQVS